MPLIVNKRHRCIVSPVSSLLVGGRPEVVLIAGGVCQSQISALHIVFGAPSKENELGKVKLRGNDASAEIDIGGEYHDDAQCE